MPIPHRRTRFDTNQTVIDASDFQAAAEDDENLAIGENDAMIDDKGEEGIVDHTGVAFVNMLKEDSSADIYPATTYEFSDYLKRGKITALRNDFCTRSRMI